MHGTFVNSHPLERNKEYKLHSGDELRFGMNVVRDQGKFARVCFLEPQADPTIVDSFIAKKYRFQSHITPAISRGFSVPDVDTEEEDMDIEDETALPPVCYGSESNPVNIDDFEDVPQQVFNLDEEELAEDNVHAFVDVEADQSDEDEEAMDEYDGVDEAQNQSTGLLSDSRAAPEEGDSDDEVDHTNADSEGEDDASNSSQAGSMSNGDSDAETDSESEAEDVDAVRRLKLEAMLKHERADHDEQVPRPSTRPALSSPYTVQATCKYQDLLQTSPALNCCESFSEKFADTVSPKEVERATHSARQGNLFAEPLPTSVWEPLPPRLAAPKTSMWDPPVPDVSNTYAREQISNPWFEPTPSTMDFSYSAPQSRPMKMDYLGQVLNSEPAPAPVMGMPTPPMPASDEVNPMNAQANPRTKVSISEIVEDTQQQPPSPPQSVASPTPKSLKRKAEVLDSDEKDITPAPPALAVQDPTVTEIFQAPQAAVAEPPAKRQRGALAAAARTAATFVAGGLFAVGCLVMSPDSAFK
jgi:hypothetical protein